MSNGKKRFIQVEKYLLSDKKRKEYKRHGNNVLQANNKKTRQ